jgi:hypothetical protein
LFPRILTDEFLKCSGALLDDADLGEAMIGETNFGNTDLSKVRGLSTVVHFGPSTIGIDTCTDRGIAFRKSFFVGAAFRKTSLLFFHRSCLLGTQSSLFMLHKL